MGRVSTTPPQMVLPREFSSVADVFPCPTADANSTTGDKDETISGIIGSGTNDDTATVVDGDELLLTTQGRPTTAGAFLDADDDMEDGDGLADELIKVSFVAASTANSAQHTAVRIFVFFCRDHLCFFLCVSQLLARKVCRVSYTKFVVTARTRMFWEFS